MSKFLLARKSDMTRMFDASGAAVAVTRLQADPCVVTQVKTKDRDGYLAVQVGSGVAKRALKPRIGHAKASGKTPKTLREFRIGDGAYEVGQTLDVSQFNVGDRVFVTGASKGRGFQGVVKRHHFHGHPTTHGHKDQARMPGSIGAGGVQHVRKGRRMAGRMGNARVTVHHLTVAAIDQEKHVLTLSGAVPGARNSLILVQAE